MYVQKHSVIIMIEQDRIHYNIKYYKIKPGLDPHLRGGFSRGRGVRAILPAVTHSMDIYKMYILFSNALITF